MNIINSRRGIGRISDDEVRARTGLSWFEWGVALDAWEGDTTHLRSAIGYLKEKYGLDHYWAQIVATDYLSKRLS